MNISAIKEEQLDFYRSRKAGCIFAAIAAKNPEKYGWHQEVIDNDSTQIEQAISKAVESSSITTLSLIFPHVTSISDLINLIDTAGNLEIGNIERDEIHEDARCIGIRIRVNGDNSWVSGFGPFSFLPKTRQAPYTELAFRVKPRPVYDWFMKPPIAGVIHLADMDMKGVKKRTFVKWWNASLKNTKKVLGKTPDLKSAAKTTYAIPIKYFS